MSGATAASPLHERQLSRLDTAETTTARGTVCEAGARCGRNGYRRRSLERATGCEGQVVWSALADAKPRLLETVRVLGVADIS